MAILEFEEAMEQIEGTKLEDFKQIWDLAVETCAQIADDCIEHQIAAECRDLRE